MTYRVYAKMTTELYLDVEANSEEEAMDIAEETDGGDFTEVDSYFSGSWDVTHAVSHVALDIVKDNKDRS